MRVTWMPGRVLPFMNNMRIFHCFYPMHLQVLQPCAIELWNLKLIN